VDRKRQGTYILVKIINNRGSINIVIVGHYLTRLRGVLRYSNPSVDRVLGIPHAQISVPTQHDHITLGSHGPLNWRMLFMQLIRNHTMEMHVIDLILKVFGTDVIKW